MVASAFALLAAPVAGFLCGGSPPSDASPCPRLAAGLEYRSQSIRVERPWADPLPAFAVDLN
jgi:hypothetical protein